jgi:hypothetical protein
MSQVPSQPGPDRDADLPAGVAGDLRALYRSEVAPPAGMDEAVLSLARERAAVAGRGRRVRRLLPWGMVAAAGLALGAFIGIWRAASGGPAAALTGDVNADGRVDILDALVLARRIQPSGGPAAPAARGAAGEPRVAAAPPAQRPHRRDWDLNHDGAINEADVALIARQAVRLTPSVGGRPG